ncbi:MAG: hypothetical protein WCH99_04785 [Verrucomicrobiota bacterium]
MNAFFDSVEKQARLRAVAESWKGTKFMPNAAVKGSGVSCQTLVGAIYAEVGFMPAGFLAPAGPMNWSHAHKNSRIVAYMETLPQLAALPAGTAYEAGDMVGFKLGACVQHCGIVLDAGGDFVHCMRPEGVLFNTLKDATYMARIGKLWRPLKT